MDKRIRIISGHYGSGKTEFAVNYAVKLASEGMKTTLVDLDIVNVYFRSREKAQLLEDKGVHVISSTFGHSANLDVPAISPAVLTPLEQKDTNVVLDLGGNAVGARVLARYKHLLTEDEYDLFLVVNVYREDTVDAAGIKKQMESIEVQTGLKVTGLISNTHLLRDTKVSDVEHGYKIVKSISEEYNVYEGRMDVEEV